jgi:type III pantothenate kinase
MLLTVDIGNTNIVCGIYKGNKLQSHWRTGTVRRQDPMAYQEQLGRWCNDQQIPPQAIDGAVIASVVPPVDAAFQHAVRSCFHIDPLMVNHRLRTGLNLQYDQPEKLGADRLVNAVAAYTLYGGPVIILDLGTATKLCVVTEHGDYLGGIIAPGIKIGIDALANATAKLPRFEPTKPPAVIGRSTVHCLQSGIINGHVAMIRGLVRMIETELGLSQIRVIATGGLARLVAAEIPEIDRINEFLTLEGLRIIYEKNRDANALSPQPGFQIPSSGNLDKPVNQEGKTSGAKQDSHSDEKQSRSPLQISHERFQAGEPPRYAFKGQRQQEEGDGQSGGISD